MRFVIYVQLCPGRFGPRWLYYGASAGCSMELLTGMKQIPRRGFVTQASALRLMRVSTRYLTLVSTINTIADHDWESFLQSLQVIQNQNTSPNFRGRDSLSCQRIPLRNT